MGYSERAARRVTLRLTTPSRNDTVRAASRLVVLNIGWLLLLVVLTMAAPSTAAAQPGGCFPAAPCVTITPGDSVYDRNLNPKPDTVVSVYITYCSSRPLNWDTRYINIVPKAPVILTHTTGGYGQCAYGGTSTGTVTLRRNNEGLHQFSVTIEDIDSYMGSDMSTWR